MIIPRIKPITNKRLEQLKKHRGASEYRNWRNKVLERDNHKCQYPGCNSSESLEIHHIKKWIDAKHLRTAVYNGITLCEKHHTMITGNEGRYEMFFFKIAMSNMKIQKKKDDGPKN